MYDDVPQSFKAAPIHLGMARVQVGRETFDGLPQLRNGVLDRSIGLRIVAGQALEGVRRKPNQKGFSIGCGCDNGQEEFAYVKPRRQNTATASRSAVSRRWGRNVRHSAKSTG